MAQKPYPVVPHIPSCLMYVFYVGEYPLLGCFVEQSYYHFIFFVLNNHMLIEIYCIIAPTSSLHVKDLHGG